MAGLINILDALQNFVSFQAYYCHDCKGGPKCSNSSCFYLAKSINQNQKLQNVVPELQKDSRVRKQDRQRRQRTTEEDDRGQDITRQTSKQKGKDRT